MSSASRESQLIQAARTANRKALSTLTAVMLKRNVQTHLAWKGIEKPSDKSQYHPRSDREGVAGAFWFPLIEAAEKFAHTLFKAKVLWASISLDEKSEVGKATLGLESAVVLHTALTAEKRHAFQYSATRAFLEHREALPRTHRPGGIGILATKHRLEGAVAPDQELHFLFLDKGRFRSAENNDHFVPAIEAIHRGLERRLKWDEYISSYQQLAEPPHRIQANVSATSFYNAVESDTDNDNDEHIHQAVAQIVVGLDKIPADTGEALLYYQLLQLLVGGIPPLYSSLSLNARELRRLRTQDARMRLIERPLARISYAFARVQADTQELNAVLYEPARSLFRAHRAISDLFTEGLSCQLSPKVYVTIRHNMLWIGADTIQGQAVVATALCRILGRTERLLGAESPASLVALARDELLEIERPKDLRFFDEISKELHWLCGLKEGDPLSHALDLPPLGVLKRIKRALFDPFKIHATEWPVLPLILAARCFRDPRCQDFLLPNETDTLSFDTGVDATLNPTICQHVVELFMAVSAALQHPRVSGLEIIQEAQRKEIRLKYMTDIVADEQGVKDIARHISNYLFDSPREWRVEDQQIGNWQKPFIDFASRLLDLKRDEAAPVRWTHRHSVTQTRIEGRHSLISLNEEVTKQRFALFIDQPLHSGRSELVVQWTREGYKPRPAVKVQAPTPAPQSAPVESSPAAFLLDHCYRSRPFWRNALTAAGLIAEENSQDHEYPANFLSRRPRCSLVFLHTGDVNLRHEWNRATINGDFKGHLVHVSIDAFDILAKAFPCNHPQIHNCERPHSDFYRDMAPFVASTKAGLKHADWTLLGAPSVPAGKKTPPPAMARPAVILVARDESAATLAGQIDAKLITGRMLESEFPSATEVDISEVTTVVLAHDKSEQAQALVRRHNHVRAHLKKAQAGGPLAVRWLIWTHDVPQVLSASVVTDKDTHWTFGEISRRWPIYQILESRESASLLSIAINKAAETSKHSLAEIERLLEAYHLPHILTQFKRLVMEGWSPALKEMAKVVAKNLSDALTEMQAAAWYPKPRHHLLARQLLSLAADLARSPNASSVNTQTLVTKLRANLAKLTIPPS